jgi:hypothetical protein
MGRLRLLLDPTSPSGTIRALIEAEGVPTCRVTIEATPGIAIEGDSAIDVGSGSFKKSVEWKLRRTNDATAQESVEIFARAGDYIQAAAFPIPPSFS